MHTALPCRVHERLRPLLPLFALMALLGLSSFMHGCGDTRSMTVTATAYTSTPAQTQGDPFVGAWGDRLKPGMKAIAVSRDLLKQGLTHGDKVRIEGLDGSYAVLDKLNKRFEKRIDIYMGLDTEAARKWGKRSVRISWEQ